MEPNEIRYDAKVVSIWLLNWIGRLLNLGTPPVHTRIYWRFNGQCYMSELTNSSPVIGTETVGKGDGYTIQITPVNALVGITIAGDASKVEFFARKYASVEKGNLTSLPYERQWHEEPQGYGGPLYDRCTSNTYAAWLLKHVCPAMPATPTGATGWNQIPLFPGPIKNP